MEVFGSGCKDNIIKNVTWYRGINNAKYNLLPSIFVRFNNNIKAKYNTVLRYQKSLFDQFKAKADGAIEMGQISNSNMYGVADYLVLMQHYSVYTNLMDWSEDLISSMYFAFEKYIDQYAKDADDRKNSKDNDVAIYLFDPELYNEARRKMIKAVEGEIPDDLYGHDVIKTISEQDDLLPNISSPYNKGKYKAFLHSSESGWCKYSNGIKIENLSDKEDEVINVPIAILTSRLNPRIRVQSGTFLAYNLYASPSSEPDDKGFFYSYLALDKIQEYYIKKFHTEKPQLFLYKITIPSNQKDDFADKLRTIGIRRSQIYPELNWLGEDLVVQ